MFSVYMIALVLCLPLCILGTSNQTPISGKVVSMGKSETMFLELSYVFDLLVVERIKNTNKIRDAEILSMMEDLRRKMQNGSTHMILTVEISE